MYVRGGVVEKSSFMGGSVKLASPHFGGPEPFLNSGWAGRIRYYLLVLAYADPETSLLIGPRGKRGDPASEKGCGMATTLKVVYGKHAGQKKLGFRAEVFSSPRRRGLSSFGPKHADLVSDINCHFVCSGTSGAAVRESERRKTGGRFVHAAGGLQRRPRSLNSGDR